MDMPEAQAEARERALPLPANVFFMLAVVEVGTIVTVPVLTTLALLAEGMAANIIRPLQT